MNAIRGAAAVAVSVLSANAAIAETETFDQEKAGATPAGWSCGVTGKGNARWMVDADPSAPSGPNVLRQSGSGTFPWCMKTGTSVADGFVDSVTAFDDFSWGK